MASPKILLAEWAKLRYDPPPSDWTLRRWARDGELHPPPEKVGRNYYVDPATRRITDYVPAGGRLVDRLGAA